MRPNDWLAEIALEELAKNVREVGGSNKGPDVEKYQKAANGKAEGEPYCLGFVQYCLDEVERRHSVKPITNREVERVWTFFHDAPAKAMAVRAMRGFIICWHVIDPKNPNGTNGHAGIIIGADGPDKVITVEANTTPDKSEAGKEREGDGVYRRTRLLAGSPNFKVMGILDPYAIA